MDLSLFALKGQDIIKTRLLFALKEQNIDLP